MFSPGWKIGWPGVGSSQGIVQSNKLATWAANAQAAARLTEVGHPQGILVGYDSVPD
jgi:hypothetical protein